jgi:16S rRNA (cytosine967-C5)-methyltransferase
MSSPIRPSTTASWSEAARLIARWLERRERIDVLLDTLPSGLAGAERARCQHLVLGVVRHFGRIDAALTKWVSHPPRFITRAILSVAGFELIEAAHGAKAEAEPSGEAVTGQVAKIVHHAVERAKGLASPAEARLINAVVRKLAPLATEAAPSAGASPETLAEYFSHPVWLVKSWLAQFGPDATRALLEWNQSPAPVYARWRAEEPVPAFLKPTRWTGFHEVESGHWPEVEPLLKTGKLYLQDPSTRVPVELLAPQVNETLLDLCAAPGGKALLIADAMKTGRLVSVDLPSSRIDRLKENLSRAGAVEVALVQADILNNFGKILAEHQLSATYDGVLIDVPCSNTGVMRHRVDVKWRLQEGDFKKHPQQQLSMLHTAARLVAPRGRLVYSTCSIDTEENEHVVKEFLASRAGGGFMLEKSVLSFPWTDGHDGGGAFLLRKTAG